MLNRTGNTDGKVYVRTNGLASLANLQIFRLPAGVHNSTRAAYSTADCFSKLVQNLKVLRASYSAAAGNKNLCIHNICNVGNCLNNFHDLNILLVGNKSRIELLNLCLSSSLSRKLLQNAGTNGSHLRAEIRAGNGSDCISTECRTCHKKLTVLLLLTRRGNKRKISDIKLRTVSSKARMDTCTNTRAKVTANGSSAD